MTQESLCIGTARFTNPAHKAIAEREGVLAAWRQAYADHGVQAAAAVEREFAVAFDTPDGGTYLAIDKFAVRTLCYRIKDGRLVFAERADALADDAELDPQALFDYLYFHVIPSPRTVFKDVFRLPAGHYALFRNGELTVAPYWRPAFDEIRSPSFAALRDEFRRLVEESVISRIDDAPTGCYLSGGTDSSTVAGMTTRLTGRPAETYSIGFDAEGYDEMEYARIAARHFGTHHHEYYVTPNDLVAGIPEVARSYDQPFGNSSAVPAYFCALAAQKDGIETLLAGDGGDELFGGNSRYAKQRVFGAYDGVPTFLRRGVLEPLVNTGLFDPVPGLKKGASYIRQARIPMPDRMQTYNLLARIGLTNILTPDFLNSIDTGEPHAHQQAVYASCPSPASLVNKMLYYDWRYTLAENDLPKVVGSAALAGVRVAFPFLDDQLLAFSLRLPTDYKLKGLKLRWFFKEALRGFLPDEILTKKKHGFGLPFGRWAVANVPLKRLARDSLEGLAGRGLVRTEFVGTLLEQHLPSHPGFYGELVWIMMMLEQWLRAHAPNYRVN